MKFMFLKQRRHFSCKRARLFGFFFDRQQYEGIESSDAWKPSRCIGSVAGGSVGLVGGSLLGHFSPRGGSWSSSSHSNGCFFYIFLRPCSGKPWKTMENPHVWLSWNHPSWKILAFLGFLDSLGPANKLASQRGCRRPTTIFNIFVLKSIKITTVNHYHYNQCPCWSLKSLLNHYILTICPGENWCCWSCGGVWPTGIGEVYSGTISTVTRHSLAWFKMVVFPWKMVVFPLKNGDFP